MRLEKLTQSPALPSLLPLLLPFVIVIAHLYAAMCSNASQRHREILFARGPIQTPIHTLTHTNKRAHKHLDTHRYTNKYHIEMRMGRLIADAAHGICVHIKYVFYFLSPAAPAAAATAAATVVAVHIYVYTHINIGVARSPFSTRRYCCWNRCVL